MENIFSVTAVLEALISNAYKWLFVDRNLNSSSYGKYNFFSNAFCLLRSIEIIDCHNRVTFETSIFNSIYFSHSRLISGHYLRFGASIKRCKGYLLPFYIDIMSTYFTALLLFQ